jgi:enoyl-CoA hydratase
MEAKPVHIERQGAVLVVTIDRPEVRNAVDGPTAQQLYDAFVEFDADDTLSVAVLTGAHGTFCAGADLGAIAAGRGNRVSNAAENDGSVLGSLGPMGPTRLDLSKPVIAAIDGYAVAGGLELALWCDLRVLSAEASLGVFCRRWGVPLIDGGTVRLTRVVGHGRAMDLILTGREVDAAEAVSMGLATRIASGDALTDALALANDLAALPPRCMRSDRRSAIDQWAMSLSDALDHEVELGLVTIRSGETREGAARFAAGAGRHGAPTQQKG